MDISAINLKETVPIVISTIGLIITVIGILSYRKANKSLLWDSTTGTILSSKVKKSVSSGNNYGSTTTYSPEVIYKYKVQSEEFTNDKIRAFNYGSSSSDRAEKICSKYKIDLTIPVYYNPENPKESLIEPGVKTENKVLIFVGLLILIIPLIAHFFMK